MEDKWQIIISECEKLSGTTGVPVPAALYPPGQGEAAISSPWIREGILLDWLAGFLAQVNQAGAAVPAPEEEAVPAGKVKDEK